MITSITYYRDTPNVELKCFDDVVKLPSPLDEVSLLIVTTDSNPQDATPVVMTFNATTFEGVCVELLKKLVVQFGKGEVVPFLDKTKDGRLKKMLQLELMRYEA